MVANPTRGQLNREKCILPVPVRALRLWSRETGCLLILRQPAHFPPSG